MPGTRVARASPAGGLATSVSIAAGALPSYDSLPDRRSSAGAARPARGFGTDPEVHSSMARKLRIAAFSSLALLVVLVALLWSAYQAVRRVRPFYQQALQLDEVVLERGSRELESRATALYSDTQQAGRWQAIFTAEQINGWLAVQLAQNHADQLPDNVREPRVAISPEAITLGFRTEVGGTDTVVTVDATPFLTESGAIAVRLVSVHAGTLPLPVLQVADEIATACQGLSLPVRWTRHEGQPVAVIDVQGEAATGGQQIAVETIELGEGSLYVEGHTLVDKPAVPLAEAQESSPVGQ